MRKALGDFETVSFELIDGSGARILVTNKKELEAALAKLKPTP
jgi:hypothetical protein